MEQDKFNNIFYKQDLKDHKTYLTDKAGSLAVLFGLTLLRITGNN